MRQRRGQSYGCAVPTLEHVSEAQATTTRLLASSTARLDHVRGVARVAQQASEVLPDVSPLVVPAAWLHDIGYAGEVADTGLHSLDGARYLRSTGWKSGSGWVRAAGVRFCMAVIEPYGFAVGQPGIARALHWRFAVPDLWR